MTAPACLPYVERGIDYWFEPSDRGKGYGETRPEQLARVNTARTICSTCPMQAPCLDIATRESHKHGVWGSTTGKQRQGMGATRAPAECGTPSGYTAHRRRKEDACQPCKTAAAEYSRQLRAARKKAA